MDRDNITYIHDLDPSRGLTEEDEFNVADPEGASNDTRQEQLVNYMLRILSNPIYDRSTINTPLTYCSTIHYVSNDGNPC